MIFAFTPSFFARTKRCLFCPQTTATSDASDEIAAPRITGNSLPPGEKRWIIVPSEANSQTEPSANPAMHPYFDESNAVIGTVPLYSHAFEPSSLHCTNDEPPGRNTYSLLS